MAGPLDVLFTAMAETGLKFKKKRAYYVLARYVGSDGVLNWSKVRKVKTK